MAGRPKKYTDKYLKQLVESFDNYIDTTPIPILKEWCSLSGVPSNHIYDYDAFSESIKRCMDKKEAALERQALDAQINTTMAIFSLKQLGWKDKHDIEHTGAVVVQFDRDDERL